MIWLARIVGLLALAIALSLAGLMLAGHLSAHDPTQPIGNLWFAVDAASLNAAQVVLERYIWPPLWSYVVFPFLTVPAPLAALTSAGGALVLFLVGRRRKSGL